MHKYAYLDEVDEIIIAYCNERKLPRRNHKNGKARGDITTNRVVLEGTNLSFNELKSIITDFRDEECYEILFHPGKYDPNCKSSLNKKREDDTKKN